MYDSIIQSIFTLPTSSGLCLFILPPSPTPATLGLFTIFIILPFPECHIVGTIQYVAFSDWLLSLSDKHLSFLHVFSWLASSSLFSALAIFHRLDVHAASSALDTDGRAKEIQGRLSISLYLRATSSLVGARRHTPVQSRLVILNSKSDTLKDTYGMNNCSSSSGKEEFVEGSTEEMRWEEGGERQRGFEEGFACLSF